jgi:hypothetical protein
MDLKKIIEVVFTHAGIVTDVGIEWETSDLCRINVNWLPWSKLSPEDITSTLLDAGTIVDDSHLYLRVEKCQTVMKGTITIDLADKDWRRNLAKQFGLILSNELRQAVATDE